MTVFKNIFLTPDRAEHFNIWNAFLCHHIHELKTSTWSNFLAHPVPSILALLEAEAGCESVCIWTKKLPLLNRIWASTKFSSSAKVYLPVDVSDENLIF